MYTWLASYKTLEGSSTRTEYLTRDLWQSETHEAKDRITGRSSFFLTNLPIEKARSKKISWSLVYLTFLSWTCRRICRVSHFSAFTIKYNIFKKKFTAQENIREMDKDFRHSDFWNSLGGQALWFVNVCLEYHRLIMTNACPPKRPQKKVRRKLVPISLIVSEVGN